MKKRFIGYSVGGIETPESIEALRNALKQKVDETDNEDPVTILVNKPNNISRIIIEFKE